MPKGIYKRSPEMIDKCIANFRLASLSSPKGKNHYRYKGDKVGYKALHAWVNRVHGSPNKCEKCGDTSKRKYEWANKSGLYKRDIKDWVRLCVPCHRKFDGTIRKGSSHFNSKLNKEIVMEIRKLYRTGNYSSRDLGKMFNIAYQTAWGIATRKTWKHVKKERYENK